MATRGPLSRSLRERSLSLGYARLRPVEPHSSSHATGMPGSGACRVRDERRALLVRTELQSTTYSVGQKQPGVSKLFSTSKALSTTSPPTATSARRHLRLTTADLCC